jgi:hypothetical protein
MNSSDMYGDTSQDLQMIDPQDMQADLSGLNEDLGGMVDQPHQIIHFQANLVQGAVQQANTNYQLKGLLASAAIISHSNQYQLRAILNP